MKVKELAEIFKISAAELLAILPNVGVDVSQKEETNVDKEVEKKLAKRYGVPYPFKKAAPKPKLTQFSQKDGLESDQLCRTCKSTSASKS